MACYFSAFVFLIFTNPQSTDDQIPKPSLLKMTSSEKTSWLGASLAMGSITRL